MEEKIMITCDSALDLSAELTKKYNIKVLPMIINMGSDQCLDIEDATPDDILKYHDETGDLAVTGAPTVQHAFRFFTRLVHMGYTVIHFTLSSGLSTAFDNAQIAAESFERVHVIDSMTASVAGGLLVINAAEMLQEGKSSEEIIRASRENIARAKEPFLIDEMEFLYKGGRASALSAFAANIFNIKPSLFVSDGKLVVGKKYYGKFQSVVPKFINAEIGNGKNIDKRHFFIGHTGLPEDFLEACKVEVDKSADFQDIQIIRAGSTITSHLGKNALILAWLNKT